MKILSEKELDIPIKKIMRFRCSNCDCTFEADDDEYKKCEPVSGKPFYECKCPNCSYFSYANDEDNLNVYRSL